MGSSGKEKKGLDLTSVIGLSLITMFTGEKMLVREPQEFIIQKIMLLRRKILRGILR